MNTARGRIAEEELLAIGYADNSEITLDTLADLRLLAQKANDAIWFQAEVLRRRGESWQSIGDSMGISRQAVHKRLSPWID